MDMRSFENQDATLVTFSDERKGCLFDDPPARRNVPVDTVLASDTCKVIRRAS